MNVQHHFYDNVEALLKLLSPLYDKSEVRYIKLIRYEDDGGASDIIYAQYVLGFADGARQICIYSCDYPESVEHATELISKWLGIKSNKAKFLKQKENQPVFIFEIPSA